MLEQLNGLSKELTLHVFTLLVQDYVRTLENKIHTIASLKKQLEIKHNSLYKARETFESSNLFNVEEKTSGFQLRLNLENELVKELVAMEYFRINGLSFATILGKEGLDEVINS